jgi:hypothetical protein
MALHFFQKVISAYDNFLREESHSAWICRKGNVLHFFRQLYQRTAELAATLKN